VLLSLFLPLSTIKKRNHLNQQNPTAHPIQSHPSNPRDVKKEIIKAREEAFICMFCGRAGHLDECYFRRKRIEKRHFDYPRNSHRDEFSDFLPHSYSPALPRTSSHALPHFSHRPNHCSYDFGSRENNFVHRCFSYGPRPHRGDRFSCRPSFPTGGSHTCL
jgi:hypothetical protein